MGYLFLMIALLAGATKGYCGKKTSGYTDNFGDAVLAKSGGVLFIPSHLVEEIVLTSEFTKLSDEFAEDLIRRNIFTAGELDSVWDENKNKMFLEWIENYPGKLPMPKEDLDRYLKARNF